MAKKTLLVRLAPWASARIERQYGGVTKKSVRQSLIDTPGTEFQTVGVPAIGQRAGAVATVREAFDLGYGWLEVRYNDDRSVLMVAISEDGNPTVL